MTPFRRALRDLLRPPASIGVALFAVIFVAALGSFLVGYDPVLDVNTSRANLQPSATAWLGTDHLGRHVFMRLITAGGTFLWPSTLAAIVALTLAVPSGALAGWFGGAAAAALRFIHGCIAAIPRFVLVLLASSIYGADLRVLGLTAGIAYAPTLAEAVYARIEDLKRADYVLANRAHGLSSQRILWQHLVWWGCGRLILRHAVLVFVYVIVLETTLSYLGSFGVQEPTPSWGNMLVFEWGRDGNNAAFWAPSLAIWLTVLSLVWVAEGLQEEARG